MENLSNGYYYTASLLSELSHTQLYISRPPAVMVNQRLPPIEILTSQIYKRQRARKRDDDAQEFFNQLMSLCCKFITEKLKKLHPGQSRGSSSP